MKFRSHRVCLSRGALCALLLAAAWPATAERIVRDGLVYDAVSPSNAALAERLAPLQQARGFRFLDWLANGSLLVAMRGEDTEQLHRLDTPLGAPDPLHIAGNDPQDRVVAAVAQPYQSDALAVLRQAPGGGPTLLRVALDGAEARVLMGADWRAESPLWAHDGQRLACSATLRGTGRDVFLLDSRTADPPRQLAAEPGDWQALDWSLDDRYLLLWHRTPLGVQQLQWLDVDSGARRVLVEIPAGSALHEPRIAPDGRGVLYLAGKDWLRLQYTSLDGQATRALTPPMQRHVEHYAISGDGRWLAYSYDDNGLSRLLLLDQRQSTERVIGSLPAGVITTLQFDRTGARLAINIETTLSPPDIFVLDVASNALVRWTSASAGPLGVNTFSPPQPVRFRAWRQNGTSPQGAALLYRPPAAAVPAPGSLSQTGLNAARLPVLIYLDSEDGQPRPRFDPLLQSLVAAGGFAVVAPELRGRLETSEGRADAVRDVGTLLIWIATQPDLDSSRIAIFGAGPRSAVALGALALFSDRLQSGVVLDGDASGVPLLAIEKPVLVARGFVQPQLLPAAGDRLLWRLRAARSPAALFGPVDDVFLEGSAAQRAELARVVLEFLVTAGNR